MVVIITVATVDIRAHRLILWDLGGQEDLQQLWDKVCVVIFNSISHISHLSGIHTS